METHLLDIHNASVFSGESETGQTLNDCTTDATLVPTIIDHLMPTAKSNSKSAKRKAQSIEILKPIYKHYKSNISTLKYKIVIC